MGRKAIDMTGMVCSRLTVIDRAGLGSNGAEWNCVCACGRTVSAAGPLLRRGAVKSCGCLKAEVGAAHLAAYAATGKHAALRHGEAKAGQESVEWRTWHSVKRRCDPAAARIFPDYAGRGISMHQDWRQSFEAFVAAVGRRPGPGYSLDRYPNNDGNYEPGNVRWATRKQQARNRRNSLYIECGNEWRTLAEWSEITGLKNTTIRGRLRAGWPVERALQCSRKE
jgi:hypothetical protein